MKNKFNVGDLVVLPEESGHFGTDFGVIIKVDPYVYDDGKPVLCYHIHWAIDRETTIEDAEWFHETIELVARA